MFTRNIIKVLTEIPISLRYGVIVVITSLTCLYGCATQPEMPAKAETFTMPYRYDNSLGVGAGDIDGILVLPQGTETDIVSRAIVMALQGMELSIIEPKLTAGERLPEKQPWHSDRVPVAEALISTHNDSHPDLSLPSRYYEIQYLGSYVVDRRQLVFKISAQLFERTLASDWREYQLPYSGSFFVNRLGRLIQENLLKVAEELQP